MRGESVKSDENTEHAKCDGCETLNPKKIDK